MNAETIKKVLEESQITTEIACKQAFEIAEKYGIPKKDIGDYCTKHDIKIRHCQLGCFR